MYTARSLRRMLMAGTILTAAAAASSAAAQVAATTQATTTDAATPADAQDAGGDIVVTAQRRAERLQDVPLSITALTGEQIKNQDISDVSRLEQVVPGLRLGRSGASERPAIRGVYTEAIGLNSDPRIGFYIDEIYQARTQQTTAALVDLERVEVQKGPQGTLFGRNSYGGNVALTTATPKDRVEGGIDLTGGNYGRFRAEGYYNQPLADGLAVRLAGEYERHDGYLKSTVNSNADLQDKNEYYLRGSLRWTPAALGGKLDVLAHASYYNRTDKGFNSINGKVIGVAVDPTLVTKPGGTLVYNGVNYTFTAPANGTGGFNGANPGTGTLYPYTNAFRDGIADVNGADIGIPVPGKYQSIYDATPSERLHQQQYSLAISYDLGPLAKLRSITSYTLFHTVNGGDGDGGPLPIQYFVTGTDSKVFTQEVQLQSNDAGSPLKYTLGGFYLYENDREGSAYYYLNRTYTTAGAAAAGLPVYYGAGNAGIGGSPSACTYSYATPAACSLNLTTGNLFDSRSENAAKTRSYAVYGQASYTINQKLTLTAGIRYTIDKKFYESIAQSQTGTQFVSQYVVAQGIATTANQFNYYAVNPYYSDTFANLTCGGYTSQPFSTAQSNQPVGVVPQYYGTQCGNRTFRFVTYRLAADYKLTPDNLLYASFSTGRHSGGFGSGVFAASSPNGSFTTFDSEGVYAWEIGSKNQFLDRRLQVNLTAFYNYYTHVQQQGTQLVLVNGTTFSPQSIIFNTGSEKAPGVDLSILAKPTQALKLSVDVNYLHARYSKYPFFVPASFICFYLQGGCTGGTTSTGAPANYGVGGGYFPNAETNPADFPATGVTSPSGYAYSYIPTNRRVQNTPDWSVQFGAAYDIDLGNNGVITPQFHTLWSGDYLLSTQAPNILQKSYFKTDARIAWVSHDGRLSAQVFVENLENSATLGRITVNSTGQVQGTYSDPRTFGGRIGYRF